MFSKLILFTLSCAYAFVNPSIKLDSGKSISLIGKGPPLFLSTGLFGTMPRFFYSDLVNQLKKNLTIVTINGFQPIEKKDIEEVAQTLQVDKLAYLSHSSYFADVLTSEFINSAILLDPINIPKINFGGIDKPHSRLNFPALIIKAEKLYEGKKNLPDWQNPEFDGIIEEEIYEGVGHPDILNDMWANIANNIGFWETAKGEISNFEDWDLKKRSEIPKMRQDYRNYVAKKILTFINTKI